MNWLKSRVTGLFVNLGMATCCALFIVAQPPAKHHKPAVQPQEQKESEDNEIKQQEAHIEYLDRNLQDLKLDLNTYATWGKAVAATVMALNTLGVIRKWAGEEKK